MGTFAGNNGHRTANPAEGQPTRDAAYEWVAREFLRKFSLDRDEGFAAAVARRFMEAPAKVGCPAIGKWIDKSLLHFGWTQNDLADCLGVDRSAVAKWTAGGPSSQGGVFWNRGRGLIGGRSEIRSDLQPRFRFPLGLWQRMSCDQNGHQHRHSLAENAHQTLFGSRGSLTRRSWRRYAAGDISSCFSRSVGDLLDGALGSGGEGWQATSVTDWSSCGTEVLV